MPKPILTLRRMVQDGQLSPEAIAALIGCRARTVESWLSGKQQPSRMAAKAIVRAARQVEATLGGQRDL